MHQNLVTKRVKTVFVWPNINSHIIYTQKFPAYITANVSLFTVTGKRDLRSNIPHVGDMNTLLVYYISPSHFSIISNDQSNTNLRPHGIFDLWVIKGPLHVFKHSEANISLSLTFPNALSDSLEGNGIRAGTELSSLCHKRVLLVIGLTMKWFSYVHANVACMDKI